VSGCLLNAHGWIVYLPEASNAGSRPALIQINNGNASRFAKEELGPGWVGPVGIRLGRGLPNVSPCQISAGADNCGTHFADLWGGGFLPAVPRLLPYEIWILLPPGGGLVSIGSSERRVPCEEREHRKRHEWLVRRDGKHSGSD